MHILGIWDGHDSGAALVSDGRVVAAVNEERLSRRKLEIAFPERSIRECLRITGLEERDINLVACSTSDVAKTLGRWIPGLKESYYRLRRRKVDPGRGYRLRKRAKYWITEWGPFFATRGLSDLAVRRRLRCLNLGEAPLGMYDHHLCHAAGAAVTSGMDPCLAITIDGVGDGLSATVSRYENGRLTRIEATPARDSVGIFFEHVTNLMNMRELEDEGKVMALADYCLPIADADNPCLDLLQVDGLRFRAAIPGHAMGAVLERVHWRFDREQFAFLAQRTVETIVPTLVREAVRATGIRRIALSGGVASNVKMSRCIRLLPEVEDVFVFPHMGDGGLALGAALAAAQARSTAVAPLDDGLGFGPEYSATEMAVALRDAGCSCDEPIDLAAAVTALLAREKVVLWFQGRMEYGPRALGARSVLARPDRPSIRDRLNLVLKRRAWYQPFCPSLLESEARLVLADLKGRLNRYMAMAYVVREEHRDRLAGVIGRDGSCRPQIIPDDAPGPYADLLRAVRKHLGFGAVLNTSFNMHGEPLVNAPAEAVDVFRRSGADALVMGPYLVIGG